MRNLAVFAVIVLVMASLMPVASGMHLSAGVNDGVPHTYDEAPTPEDRSVPLVRQQDGAETECFEADGSVDDIEAGLNSDAFCGRLVYHPDLSGAGLTQEAPTDTPLDQDFPGPFERDDGLRLQITSFDVIYTSEGGIGVAEDGFTQCFVPGTPPAHTVIHETGAQVGLTTGDEAGENGGKGCDGFTLAAQMRYPSASRAVQDASGDAMDMNGWLVPSGKSKWVGQIQADLSGGDLTQKKTITVTQRALTAIVLGEDLKAGDNTEGEPAFDLDGDGVTDGSFTGVSSGLPDGAQAEVCGFTPDLDLGDIAGSICEIKFDWLNEPAGQDGAVPADRQPAGSGEPLLYSENYQSECAATAYVCSGFEQGAWYSDLGSTFTEDSTEDYDVYHWIVAPTESLCEGDQEPGFAFDPDPSSSKGPYLAQDLDVYTTPTTAAGITGQEHAVLAAEEVANVSAIEEDVDEAIEDNTPQAVPDTIDAAEEQANAVTFLTDKTDREEPNAIGDTSQIGPSSGRTVSDTGTPLETLDRGLAAVNQCQVLRGEVETNADPWVPRIDVELSTDVVGGVPQPFLNLDQDQDDANQPGPYQYFNFFQMGIVTDRDDDGEYAWPGETGRFNDPQAYPLLWDMRIQKAGDGTWEVAPGCTESSGDEQTLSEEMYEAGYGLNTGVIAATYLPEPTYFLNFNTAVTTLFPQGDRVYVAMSNVYLEKIRAGLEASEPGNLASDLLFVEERINEVVAKTDSGHTFDAETLLTGEDDRVEIMAVEHYTDTERENFGEHDLDFTSGCSFPIWGGQEIWSHGHYTQGGLGDGATVVTGYYLELRDGFDKIDGDKIEGFEPLGDDTGVWEPPVDATNTFRLFDVDPIDNNPDRNTPEYAEPCAETGDNNDFEDPERLECPHQVEITTATSDASGTVTLDWDPVPEEEGINARGAGDIRYVVKQGSTVVQDSDSTEFTASGLTSGTDVAYTVEAVYHYTVDMDGDSTNGVQPASYDRFSPPATATITVS